VVPEWVGRIKLKFRLPAARGSIVVSYVPAPQIKIVFHHDQLRPFVALGRGVVVFIHYNFLRLCLKTGKKQKQQKQVIPFENLHMHGAKVGSYADR
jgi:hypothetical protein